MLPAEPRDRVLAAVVVVAGRSGLRALTVDDVAREAGVGRASVYRWFPGGREQLVDEGITWEVGRFLRRMGESVRDCRDLRERLVVGIPFAHRAIVEHDVLQHLLATEPGGLLPQLQQTGPLVVAVLRDAIRPWVEAEPRRRPEVDPTEAAEWLARMVVSFMAEPGRWDLDDRAEVEALVDRELLAGIVAERPPPV